MHIYQIIITVKNKKKMKKKDTRRNRQKDKDAGAFNIKESQVEVKKGDEYLRKGNRQEAYKHYMAAVEKCQESHEAHGRLAEVLIEAKEYTRAQQHLETAIHYMPKRAKYYYLKGKAFYNSGQWEEALGEFKRAVTENENEKEPVFFYMIAEMHSKLGDYDSAIQNYKEAEKMVLKVDAGAIKPSELSHESRVLSDVF